MGNNIPYTIVHLITSKQVFEEFQLITEVDISLMKSRWLEYFPKLAGDEVLAMIELDKKLKPTGPASKCDGAFSIYEVTNINK